MSDGTGVYEAVVQDLDDPTGQGRARLLIPAAMGEAISGWAVPVTGQKSTGHTKLGDRVWAWFEHNDVSRPKWVPVVDLESVDSRFISAEQAADARFPAKITKPRTMGESTWFRLATVNGDGNLNGGHITLFVSGSGNYGSSLRAHDVVTLGQRGTGAASYTWEGVRFGGSTSPWQYYVKPISDFVFELWVYQTPFDAVTQVTVMSSMGDNTRLNNDSVTTVDPALTLLPAPSVLVGTTGAQTLSSKTLTAPVLTSPDVLGTPTGVGAVQLARKTASQTVTNSITLVNDTHLSFFASANATYEVRISLHVQNGGGFRCRLTGPGTATIYTLMSVPHAHYSTDFSSSASTDITIFDETANNAYAEHLTALVKYDTSGTVNFRWAQETAGVTDTALASGSWLTATRIA